MSVSTKLLRIIRWGKVIGFLNSFNFEIQQTIKKPLICFTHRGIKRKIYLRQGSSDIAVFEHVFIQGELDFNLDNPKLILDGGANCGLTALYLASQYPDANILAVEPNLDNCSMIKLNTSGLNVEVIETALWSRSTYLKIENVDAEPWAFHCVETVKDAPGSFMARDISSILEGRECDLVKLDIEGAEIEVFKDIEWLSKVAIVVVEIHNDEANLLIRESCKGWMISQAGEKLLLQAVV